MHHNKHIINLTIIYYYYFLYILYIATILYYSLLLLFSPMYSLVCCRWCRKLNECLWLHIDGRRGSVRRYSYKRQSGQAQVEKKDTKNKYLKYVRRKYLPKRDIQIALSPNPFGVFHLVKTDSPM